MHNRLTNKLTERRRQMRKGTLLQLVAAMIALITWWDAWICYNNTTTHKVTLLICMLLVIIGIEISGDRNKSNTVRS